MSTILKKIVSSLYLCCLLYSISAQVNYTANDINEPYTGYFRAGVNPGWYGNNWDDFLLGDLATGNPAAKTEGVGIRALRATLPESTALTYGYEIWDTKYQYYEALGLQDNTLFIGFAHPDHRDPVDYCPNDGFQTDMFANLYEPIWDNGENGTPVNDNNYYALYLYNLVTMLDDKVKFWEIWNEPGFDYTGSKGWLPPGHAGNWWENNPDPCDYKLRAPIFHYIRTLRISYEVIKSMAPDDYIVMSGIGYNSFLDVILRNTDNPNDGAVTSEFPLGGGAYFDILGFHNYPHFDGSTRYWDNNIGGFVYTRHSDGAIDGLAKKQEERRQILAQYGYDDTTYPAKQWIITEINVPRKSFDNTWGSEEVQRNYLIKLIVGAMKMGIYQTHIFNMGDLAKEEEASNEFELMGLYKYLNDIDPFEQEVNDEGIAYKSASDFLFNNTFDPVHTEQMQLPDAVNGGAFVDAQGQYKYVLWARTQTDLSENAEATYSFPNYMDLGVLRKRQWDFAQTQAISFVSANNLTLNASPIFLTPIDDIPYSLILHCPASSIQEAMASEAEGGAIVSWDVPQVASNCPNGATLETLSDKDSGDFFPFGVHVIYYKAADECGNEEECAMTIKVASTGGGLGSCHIYRYDYNFVGKFNGHRYFLSLSPKTWEDAVADCIQHGGTLATIDNPAENAFIQQQIYENAFIGLNDLQQEGNLVWQSGEAVNYTNFDTCNGCSNTDSNDRVLLNHFNGKWFFTNSEDEQFYVMEFPCIEIDDCICPQIYDPVCGIDGNTYSNACEAQCAGISQFTQGECDCICPQVYDPVCGIDGNTYSNTCEAQCAGILQFTQGECDCICPQVYDPVCGIDGNTYSNACEAQCAGISQFTQGECDTADCPNDIDDYIYMGEHNGHQYFVSDYLSTSADAQVAALILGGYLVVINDATENNFVHSRLPDMCYIGLNDAEQEGQLHWVNGASLQYDNFDFCAFCQQNDATNDYALMHHWNGGWSFSNQWSQRRFVVEIPCANPAAFSARLEVSDSKTSLLSIAPNPSMDFCQVEIYSKEEQNATFAIYNTLGQSIQQKTIFLTKGYNTIPLDVSAFPSGVYNLLMPEAHRLYSSLKFVKEE